MKPDVATTDISGELILLGTGTSVGVPSIGCGCPVCQSTNPKNKRTRCSVIMGLPEGNLLIDTSPDMRQQLLREQIGLVHAVLYTHEHADHLFGLDDLRLMQFYLDGPVTLYCEETVEARIRKSFDYAFKTLPNLHKGAVPKLQFERIGPTGMPQTEESADVWPTLSILGGELTAVRQWHGPNFDSLGFRIGNVAYCTDLSGMPEESKAALQGLDVLILDALRPEKHVTHLSLSQAIDMVEELGAKRAYFTHMSHDLEHEATCAGLPDHINLAYDGLHIPLT